jgi:hypothetical protein
MVVASLRREPHDSYLWQWLTQRTQADHLPEPLELAESLLDFDALASGPSDHLGLGLEYEADSCLQQVVVALTDFPGGLACRRHGAEQPCRREQERRTKRLEVLASGAVAGGG